MNNHFISDDFLLVSIPVWFNLTVMWFVTFHTFNWDFLGVQMVKHLSTMRETQVRSLGQEQLLEKELATYSSTLAWKIPWMEEPGRLQSMGSKRVRHDWATSLYLFNITVTFLHISPPHSHFICCLCYCI